MSVVYLAAVETEDGPVGTYQRYPDNATALWQARTLWVLGDSAAARALSRGAEAAFTEQRPGIRRASTLIPGGEDLFTMRAAQLVVRAWERAFRGEHDQARADADAAMALSARNSDGLHHPQLHRQRMLIRVLTGDLDGAMDDIRELLSRASPVTMWELLLDPVYAPLRERSDFRALVGENR